MHSERLYGNISIGCLLPSHRGAHRRGRGTPSAAYLWSGTPEPARAGCEREQDQTPAHSVMSERLFTLWPLPWRSGFGRAHSSWARPASPRIPSKQRQKFEAGEPSTSANLHDGGRWGRRGAGEHNHLSASSPDTGAASSKRQLDPTCCLRAHGALGAPEARRGGPGCTGAVHGRSLHGVHGERLHSDHSLCDNNDCSTSRFELRGLPG